MALSQFLFNDGSHDDNYPETSPWHTEDKCSHPQKTGLNFYNVNNELVEIEKDIAQALGSQTPYYGGIFSRRFIAPGKIMKLHFCAGDDNAYDCSIIRVNDAKVIIAFNYDTESG